MSYEDVKKVWMNGSLVDFADAKIHAFSHVFHYGSGIFEGARVYKTRQGSAAFRIDEHINRIYDSCKVYRMEIPYSRAEFKDAIFETIRANGYDECYIRPVVYRGLGALGVNPFRSPVDVLIAVWRWGKYLGDEAIENGVDVCVSSWNRMAPNTFPAMAKATGNYLNSALIKMEAITNGYTMLYIADEVFLTGTAAEVTPIRSVDRIPVGRGSRGPVTERIQKEFFALVAGEREDPYGWLTPLPVETGVAGSR
jgi:branched-chain amino acid aminotransferase